MSVVSNENSSCKNILDSKQICPKCIFPLQEKTGWLSDTVKIGFSFLKGPIKIKENVNPGKVSYMCHKIKTMEIDENTKIKHTKFTFYYIHNILLFTSSMCSAAATSPSTDPFAPHSYYYRGQPSRNLCHQTLWGISS